MKKNYTVLFCCLASASFMGGISLKSIFTFSPLVGYGLGMIFLIVAFVFAIRHLNISS